MDARSRSEVLLVWWFVCWLGRPKSDRIETSEHWNDRRIKRSNDRPDRFFVCSSTRRLHFLTSPSPSSPLPLPPVSGRAAVRRYGPARCAASALRQQAEQGRPRGDVRAGSEREESDGVLVTGGGRGGGVQLEARMSQVGRQRLQGHDSRRRCARSLSITRVWSTVTWP